MKKIIVGLIVIMYASGTSVFAQDLTSSHFIIRDPVVDTGGGYQSSASFKMYSAGNLNVSGDGGTSTSYIGRDGFLQYPLAQPGTLSATVTGSEIDASWGATTVADGYTVSGYNIGLGTVTGGPYTFTSVGMATSYSYFNQIARNYFLVVQTLDAFGNVIATSNQVEVTVVGSISFALSDNAVSFGSLTVGSAKYATTSGGSATLTPAHTIALSSNSPEGYTLTYDGSTLRYGSNTIAPASITGSSTGTPGTNQFALSLAGTGTATVPTSYDETSSNWDFIQNTPSVIATTSAPTSTETLSVYYLANTATSSSAGTYDASVDYNMTANY